MALPLSFFPPGRAVSLITVAGPVTGTVASCAGGWLRLAAAEGDVLVNLAQVVRAVGQGIAPADDDLPRPTSKDVLRPSSKAPGRPWSDEAIRAVIEEFLADQPDGEVAQQHGRTRHQVTVLRQAWECARGNLADDQLSPAAQLWVERIRKAMRPG